MCIIVWPVLRVQKRMEREWWFQANEQRLFICSSNNKGSIIKHSTILDSKLAAPLIVDS